jgi:hypothetical protein
MEKREGRWAGKERGGRRGERREREERREEGEEWEERGGERREREDEALLFFLTSCTGTQRARDEYKVTFTYSNYWQQITKSSYPLNGRAWYVKKNTQISVFPF